MASERNGVVKWWLRLGSIAAATIAILALAASLNHYAMAKVDQRIDEREKVWLAKWDSLRTSVDNVRDAEVATQQSVERLADVVELAVAITVETDEAERARQVRQLKRITGTPRQYYRRGQE